MLVIKHLINDDNLVSISQSVTEMNKLLEICERYKIEFNAIQQQ